MHSAHRQPATPLTKRDIPPGQALHTQMPIGADSKFFSFQRLVLQALDSFSISKKKRSQEKHSFLAAQTLQNWVFNYRCKQGA